MKKAALSTVILIFVFVGCSAPDYSARIEALESAAASQQAQIDDLQKSLDESVVKLMQTPEPTTEPTPEPTATPAKCYEYAESGPEELLQFLPEDFTHPFSPELIDKSYLLKKDNGDITLTFFYKDALLKEHGFYDFEASIAGEKSRIDWNDNDGSGFIQTEQNSYHIYNNYDDGAIVGVGFNFMPQIILDGVEKYFDRLADTDICVLPPELKDLPYDVIITFDEEYQSVETMYSWYGLERPAGEAVAEHYKELLAQKEWLDINQGEHGTGIYARLDEYHAINVKVLYVDQAVDIQIIIYNFTVDQGE